MSIKRILTAAAASVVAVSAMAVVASADGFSGSATFSDSAWWTEYTIVDADNGSINDLIGDVDPANVASITFSSDTEFKIGYNVDAENGHWYETDPQKEYVVDDLALDENAAVKLALSKGDGAEYTITWTVNLKDGGAAAPEESKTEESKTEESKTEESKTEDNTSTNANNVDTGVEGVAAVLGVAAVAAGAMIVAKKRK